MSAVASICEAHRSARAEMSAYPGIHRVDIDFRRQNFSHTVDITAYGLAVQLWRHVFTVSLLLQYKLQLTSSSSYRGTSSS